MLWKISELSLFLKFCFLFTNLEKKIKIDGGYAVLIVGIGGLGIIRALEEGNDSSNSSGVTDTSKEPSAQEIEIDRIRKFLEEDPDVKRQMAFWEEQDKDDEHYRERNLLDLNQAGTHLEVALLKMTMRFPFFMTRPYSVRKWIITLNGMLKDNLRG